MKRVDKLISQIRRQTENEDAGLNYGIKDVEFLQYLNDAQSRLQSLISSQHNNVFLTEEVYNVSRGVQEYALPDLALMENKVTTVEYSPTNSSEDYYHLESINIHRRSTFSEAYPDAYILRAGKLLLQPTPSQSGLLRINYVKRIWDLDLRRGTVLASTTSGNELTSLTLDVTSSSTPLDVDEINDSDFICIVDKQGNMKARNIPVNGINSATGAITIDGTHTLLDSESIASGDYVVAGRDTSTHSELPDLCERYLIAYAAWKILKRDSSVDFSEQQAELSSMENDIVQSFAKIDDDVHRIPLINRDW